MDELEKTFEKLLKETKNAELIFAYADLKQSLVDALNRAIENNKFKDCEKVFEFVKCECGHDCPVEFGIVNDDSVWTCPNCYIEEMELNHKAEIMPLI